MCDEKSVVHVDIPNCWQEDLPQKFQTLQKLQRTTTLSTQIMADLHAAPTDSGVLYKETRVNRTLHFTIAEARRLPKVKGCFCTAHYQQKMARTPTVWGNRNPMWIDEFTFEIENPSDTIKIFFLEERKRGVQKQLGEVLLDVSGLKKNEVVQNWYPIIAEKGRNIGELRIRLTYAVDVILPSSDYNDLLSVLIHDDLTVVRLLSAVTKDKSITARHLVNVFQARDMSDFFIKTLIKEEIDQTSSIEVLFRGNSVCTKALDHFMKLVGTLYQRDVLAPIIEVIIREASSLEVQKEKLGSEDVKHNLDRLQKITDLLLKRIFASVHHCPASMRQLFSFIRTKATEKFKNSPNVQYTSVTSFIFLRFFVPAVLNPKLFGLTAHMPSEIHMRTFTLVAGILQKLANLTKYREQELYINQLNDFLAENFVKTKAFVDELVNVQIPQNTTGKTMQRRMSVANNIQVDIHLAGLAREIEAVKPKILQMSGNQPIIVRLLTVLDNLEKKLDSVKHLVDLEERFVESTGGVDSLLSQIIQTEIPTNVKRMTLRRPTIQKEETPAAEGVTKARSGSIFSRGLKKLLPARRGSSAPKPNETLSETSTPLSSSVPEPSPIRNRPPAYSVSVVPKRDGNTLSVPPPTPSSEYAMTPLSVSTQSIDNDSLSSISESDRNQMNSSDGVSGSGYSGLSSSVGSAPMSLPAKMRLTSKRPQLSPVSVNPVVGSAPTSPLNTSNSDIISSFRQRALQNNKSAPNSSDLETKLGALDSSMIRIEWPGQEHDPSDIEAMEAQTDYYGLSSIRESEEPNGINTPGTDDSSDVIYPDRNSHMETIGEAEFEEDEEEEQEDIIVVKMEVDFEALEKEFEALEKIISEIKALPPPPVIAPRNPSEIIPELAQLEKIVEDLEEVIVKTTPKVHIGEEGLICKFCNGSIDSGSRFLVVMGHNFHEGHLNCNICARDLSETTFQWYKDKSYCFACYKKGYGIRPNCARCNEPIMTSTYTQALGKYWHPDHFSCTVCGVGFPDGTFYNLDGKPYCPKHQNRGADLPQCGSCNMPITDPNYIEALGKKWHAKHFSCDICGIQLVGQFVTYEKSTGEVGKGCEKHFDS